MVFIPKYHFSPFLLSGVWVMSGAISFKKLGSGQLSPFPPRRDCAGEFCGWQSSRLLPTPTCELRLVPTARGAVCAPPPPPPSPLSLRRFPHGATFCCFVVMSSESPDTHPPLRSAVASRGWFAVGICRLFPRCGSRRTKCHGASGLFGCGRESPPPPPPAHAIEAPGSAVFCAEVGNLDDTATFDGPLGEGQRCAWLGLV